MNVERENPECPKCTTAMIRQEILFALPQYLDEESRGIDGASISRKDALPIAVYWCPSCRYVELFAG